MNSIAIGRCETCGELIYDNNDDFYMDEHGNYFCCLDCSLSYYGIFKGENYGGE